ncbi:hypothetical protein B5X24_HaOG203147 [Helicoverpa armigera]|uniref:G-protein coupled receptors family 1 profile domain-containing protein n=1 Tax=Helicoverpa armigera TaxID=29058 RepID=A0A2W1BRD3_HELAM|nr:hypothetical protein B5X24_HaOG203147 [Helicoverpa armigera]
MDLKIILTTLTMSIMCELCLSTDVYSNTSISKLDSITNLDIKPRRDNKSDNVFEIEEYIMNTTLNKDNEEIQDSYNSTEIYEDDEIETPCVGEPEYCNLTRQQYYDMLIEYIFPQPYEWVLIATHAIVFVIGLIGNALVCIAVYRNHSMRTVTNYFIVNLAVADFMVILICLPPTVLWDVTQTWFFGTAMCRIVLYFQTPCSDLKVCLQKLCFLRQTRSIKTSIF